MTTLIRYDGPGHVLEVTSENVTINRGQVDFVSDEMAKQLDECSYADITIIDQNGPVAWPA